MNPKKQKEVADRYRQEIRIILLSVVNGGLRPAEVLSQVTDMKLAEWVRQAKGRLPIATKPPRATKSLGRRMSLPLPSPQRRMLGPVRRGCRRTK